MTRRAMSVRPMPLPATTSTRVLNPGFLSQAAPVGVAGNSNVTGPEGQQVHRYTMSKQSGPTPDWSWAWGACACWRGGTAARHRTTSARCSSCLLAPPPALSFTQGHHIKSACV